jgi:hypothetical protein
MFRTSSFTFRVAYIYIVTRRGDYKREWGGLNRELDFLTSYTHASELQVITAPSLTATLYKSLQHPLSLFQPAVL